MGGWGSTRFQSGGSHSQAVSRHGSSPGSTWNAEQNHPDTLCHHSQPPLGQHSVCWEHQSLPNPFPAGSSLPSEDPKAQRGLWESGPAESGQRGWSDSIDRNLIPNWLRRRTPARPGCELQEGQTLLSPQDFGRQDPRIPSPSSLQSLLIPHGALLHPVAAAGWEPAGRILWHSLGSRLTCRAAAPGAKSTARPSASTCRLSHLSSGLSGHLGDARGPRASLPVPAARSSLWSQRCPTLGRQRPPGWQRAQPEGLIAKIIPKDKEHWEAEVYMHLKLDHVTTWRRDDVAGEWGMCDIPHGQPPWLISLHPQHST